MRAFEKLFPVFTLFLVLLCGIWNTSFAAENQETEEDSFRQVLEIEDNHIGVEEAERIAMDTERLRAENPRICDQELVSDIFCRMYLDKCNWETLEGKKLVLCTPRPIPNRSNSSR